MKKLIKILGIITLAAAIVFSLTVCAGQPKAAAHTHSWNWTAKNAYIETGICGDCGETETKFAFDIGDTGPGGGIVFYRNVEGFTVTYDGSTAYYLEASPENLGAAIRWGSPNFLDANYGGTPGSVWVEITGTATAIGAGRKNTALILEIDNLAPAAKACADYSGGGKNDWFLPSIDELNELYEQRSHLGITTGYFWTSSEVSDDWAIGMNFAYGRTLQQQKNVNGLPRAVRAF